MNHHPVILERLGQLLPSGPRRPDTTLRGDLKIPRSQLDPLATMIEEAWSIRIDDRRIPTWRTLADVVATIADCLALEAA